MDIKQLKIDLNFLHVEELKSICNSLILSEKGKKGELILRILKFIETGEKLVLQKFPKISCAIPGKQYEFKSDALMLKGAYKNDLKTRLFFKELIGDYFHFTAFGIDWLNERWMNGNPPTYLEFAQMWKKEYQKRKAILANPKDEWAYINFMQDYYQIDPNAPRQTVLKAWENKRLAHKNNVYMILNL